MPPRLVLNKLDLDFPATGLLILGPALFFIVVVAAAVDGIVVLDEGVVADGRDTVVPGVGTRTLILSRSGCDGIRHVVMADEKGKSNKVTKERRRRAGSEKRGEFAAGFLRCPRRTSQREESNKGEREERREEERGTGLGTRGRWDGVGELSGMGNCSLLGDDDQVGRKKNRRSI